MTETEAHHYFAIQLNNRCWQLLEKKDRSAEENNELIWSAHASLLHWSKSPDCKPVNIQKANTSSPLFIFSSK